jgi:hypothetical protein
MILFEKYGQHYPLNRQSERYDLKLQVMPIVAIASEPQRGAAMTSANLFLAIVLITRRWFIPAFTQASWNEDRCADAPQPMPSRRDRQPIRDRYLRAAAQRLGSPHNKGLQLKKPVPKCAPTHNPLPLASPAVSGGEGPRA